MQLIMNKQLLLLGIALIAVQGALVAAQSYNIECPFPEGQSVSSEAECARYTACQWDSGACVMGTASAVSYRVTAPPEVTPTGYKINLRKIDSLITLFEEDIEELVLEVIQHENYHLQLKISDPNTARYEVPVPLDLPVTSASDPTYSVELPAEGDPLSLTVRRKATNAVIFGMLGALTFEDKFIQFTTSLASTYLYGFGENCHTTLKHKFDPRVTYPMFARDLPVLPEIVNEYGVQPYYQLIEDDDGNTHSVLFMNSNAMEYSTFLQPDGSPALTLRAIGGIIDLHIFMGPTPESVNIQYTNMIGKSLFPPYWSLGFHLSRYGYTGVEQVRQIREDMKGYGIPQDVQTFDIDYMERFRDFTYDSTSSAWAELPQLIDEIHTDNAKVTLILDPAVVIDWDNYPPSFRGREADAFIKWMSPDLVPSDQPAGSNDYVVGYVWPDTKTVFPDFLKPDTQQWWGGELSILHETLKYDAIWIDMNEPANFGTNMDKPFNYPPELEPWSLKCPYTEWDSPPYPTLATYNSYSESKRLSDKTVCMSTTQTDGSRTYLHYDTHSLYGWSESVATYNGLDSVFSGKRHLVLARSTYPGSGRYAIHWLGDNFSQWSQMHMSIVGMLEFNMFGIPMVGADICGFIDEPTEELCIRWMQLGAFYPFSRNHNTIGTADQDPTTSPALAAASREVLLLRYRYLPYLYTLFYDVTTNGGSVVRPLFSLDPKDLAAREVDDQFTWGTGIMVAPILLEGATSRDVYFTKDQWYDLVTGELKSQSAGYINIDAPLENIPVFVSGGSILPFQEPATTTVESRQNPFGLTIALNESQDAFGELFWDDGESNYDIATSYMSTFEYSQGTLTQNIVHGASVVEGLSIETVQFYGFPNNPSSISINDTPLDSSAWTFDVVTAVLKVSMSSLLSEPLTMVIT